MAKRSSPLLINRDQRKLLETWARAKTIAQRVVLRSRICLLAADGLTVTAIARALRSSRPTVSLWKRRFQEQGPLGLTRDAPKGPSPRKLTEDKERAIIDATLHTAPPNGTRWTTRALAEALGVSNATIARVWKAHGYHPRQKSRCGAARDNPEGSF